MTNSLCKTNAPQLHHQTRELHMKIFTNVILLIVLGLSFASAAIADGTFYLVRHAEKQVDGTKDPHLTDKGHKRAGLLAKQLSAANITKIYSSDYHRTKETAKPLAEILDLSVESYDPSKLKEFSEVLKLQAGQIVIVGHSNTTPPLAALLSGMPVEEMDESEYENLYQVVLVGDKAVLTRFKIFPIEAQ
jgi:broad specificity phosphatase PhoE